MSEAVRFDAVIQVCDSSFIQGVVYDHSALVMDLQMKSGMYRYKNVTPLEFTMLITSRSTGRTYNALFKGKKECVKLRRKQLVSGVDVTT